MELEALPEDPLHGGDEGFSGPARPEATGISMDAVDWDTGGSSATKRKGRKGRKGAGGAGGDAAGSSAGLGGLGALGGGIGGGIGGGGLGGWRTTSGGGGGGGGGGLLGASLAASAGSVRSFASPASRSSASGAAGATFASPAAASASAHAGGAATGPAPVAVKRSAETRDAAHTAVSMSGKAAALARRRNRQRIHRVAAPLPRPPPAVGAALRAVDARYAGYKAAKKVRATEADPAATTAAIAATSAAPAFADPCSPAAEGWAEEVAVAVLGHVDSGKSTIVGHTLSLAGHVDRREARSNASGAAAIGKGSFAHAWVMDRSEEERERGITIDVSVRRAALPNAERQLCILDAPGHRALVEGAIGAVAQADIALLVVPAAEGEFATATAATGTAREHAIAARSLGVTRVVVAVNKMDAVGWSEARFEAVREAMTQLLCGDLAFSKSHVVFVPVSGMAGDNLRMGPAGSDAAATGLPVLPGTSCSPCGARGLTLLEALRCVKRTTPKDTRDVCKPLRLCVADVYRSDAAGASGTIVVGRVASGWVEHRKPLVALPSAAGTPQVSVKSVQPAGGLTAGPRTAGWAGQTLELTLGGVTEAVVIRPGTVLCWPSHPVPVVSEVKVQLVMVSHSLLGQAAAAAASSAADPAVASSADWDGGDDGAFNLAPLLPVVVGSRLKWLSTTADCFCRVVAILHTTNKDGDILKHRPRILRNGCRAVVRLRFESPVPMEASKHHRRIGRFLLRQGVRTAAAGTVLRVYK
ncbi:HBS1L [Symbiodinium sp. KB8]|nr:HBS1L [Symbiodinium sp. KB8]